MTYYHISPDGNPRKCANPENCKYKTPLSEHGSTPQEAREKYELLMSDKTFSNITKNKKNVLFYEKEEFISLRNKKNKSVEDYIKLGSMIDSELHGDAFNKSKDFSTMLSNITKTGGKLGHKTYGRLINKLNNVISVFPDSVKHLDGLPFYAGYIKKQSEMQGFYRPSAPVRIPVLSKSKINSEYFSDSYKVGESDLGSMRIDEVLNGTSSGIITTRISEDEKQDFWLGDKPRGMQLKKISDSADIVMAGGKKVHVDRPLYEAFDTKEIYAHQICAWGMKGDFARDSVLSHEFAHHVMFAKGDIARSSFQMYKECEDNDNIVQSDSDHSRKDNFPSDYMSTNSEEFFAEATSQLFYPITTSRTIYDDSRKNAKKIRQWVMGIWCSQ